MYYNFQVFSRNSPLGARAVHFTRVLQAPVPALLPVYAIYSIGKVWLLKPISFIFKTVSMGNAVRVYRFGSMIRWDSVIMSKFATAIAVSYEHLSPWNH